MSDMNKVTVSIFGDHYALKSDGNEGYLQKLAAEVEARVRRMRQQNPSLTNSKASLLLALETLDERDDWREKYEKLLREIDNLNIDMTEE